MVTPFPCLPCRKFCSLIALAALALVVGCTPPVGDGPGQDPDDADAQIEANVVDGEEHALTAYVTWETDEPSLGALWITPVDPSVDPLPPRRLEGPGASTSHRLLLHDVVPDAEYLIEVTSTRESDGFETHSEFSWHSGVLPFSARWTVSGAAVTAEETGLRVLTSLVGWGAEDYVVALFDLRGQVRWYHLVDDSDGGQSPDVSVSWVTSDDPAPGHDSDDGHRVLVGGSVPVGCHAVEIDRGLGEVAVTTAQPDVYSNGYAHHTLHKVERRDHLADLFTGSDNVYIGAFAAFDGSTDTTIRVFERGYDPVAGEGVVYWELAVGAVVPSALLRNTASLDAVERWGYVHVYDENLFLAMDLDIGEPAWVFGERAGELLPDAPHLELASELDDPWFWRAHGFEVLRHPADPVGQLRLLVHDNGDPDLRDVRALEYALDPAAGTATILYASDLGFPSDAFGDIHRIRDSDGDPTDEVLVISGSGTGADVDGRSRLQFLQLTDPPTEPTWMLDFDLDPDTAVVPHTGAAVLDFPLYDDER